MSVHHHPSRIGSRSALSSAPRLDAQEATPARMLHAASKLLVWAVVGFVVLALLNTAFGT